MIAGVGNLFARGGFSPTFNARADSGAIRMEAFSNTITTSDPVASRTPAPGVLDNIFMPTMSILNVGGNPVPAPP